MATGDPFILGVNYWPREKAMYWWSDFDAGEVASEFDLMAELGLEVVRLFLLWDDFQPALDEVSEAHLGHLLTVCDLAADRGLRMDVTFFTGHMSGPNWAPGWMLDRSAPFPARQVRQVVSGGVVVDGSYRNMFGDAEFRAASRRLLEAVVGRLAGHPAVWMWNLGNEPDLFAEPANPGEGRRWIAEMVDLIRGIDPGRPITCGLHTANLFEDNGLRVDQVFAETDAAVMHGYPMYVPWARHPLDPDFVPFLCALTTALCGKPTLAEEWGGCTVPGDSKTWEWTAYGLPRQQFMAGEEAFAGYVEAVLPRLIEVGSTGGMLWCFADYADHLWDRPPCDPGGSIHERHFGLVRPDGSTKPHADVLRRFAASRPVVAEPTRTVVLDVTADEYYSDPSFHAERLYRSFVR